VVQEAGFVECPGKVPENLGKIRKDLHKILENLGKLPENTGKNGAQLLQNHMETFFGGHPEGHPCAR